MSGVTVQNLSVDPPASYNPASPGTGGGGQHHDDNPARPAGLAPGASVSIALSFAVDGHGTYWFGYDVDATSISNAPLLPGPASRTPIGVLPSRCVDAGPVSAVRAGAVSGPVPGQVVAEGRGCPAF